MTNAMSSVAMDCDLYPHGSFWSQGNHILHKSTVKSAKTIFVMVMLFDDSDPVPLQSTKAEILFRLEQHRINNWRYHKTTNELYIG